MSIRESEPITGPADYTGVFETPENLEENPMADVVPSEPTGGAKEKQKGDKNVMYEGEGDPAEKYGRKVIIKGTEY